MLEERICTLSHILNDYCYAGGNCQVIVQRQNLKYIIQLLLLHLQSEHCNETGTKTILLSPSYLIKTGMVLMRCLCIHRVIFVIRI